MVHCIFVSIIAFIFRPWLNYITVHGFLKISKTTEAICMLFWLRFVWVGQSKIFDSILKGHFDRLTQQLKCLID